MLSGQRQFGRDRLAGAGGRDAAHLARCRSEFVAVSSWLAVFGCTNAIDREWQRAAKPTVY